MRGLHITVTDEARRLLEEVLPKLSSKDRPKFQIQKRKSGSIEMVLYTLENGSKTVHEVLTIFYAEQLKELGAV